MQPATKHYCPLCEISVADFDPERTIRNGVIYHQRCLNRKDREADKLCQSVRMLYPLSVAHQAKRHALPA
jgi:hypothetical protein